MTDVMLKRVYLCVRNTVGLMVLAVLFPTLLFGETIIEPNKSDIIPVKIEITEAAWEQKVDVFTDYRSQGDS